MARLLWLEDVITDAMRGTGRAVRVHPKFRSFGRPAMADRPLGIIQHHIAGRGIATIINGRPDLSPPLAQVCPRADGSVDVVASGKANHAGKGGYRGLSLSTQVIGFENEHSGRASDPWSEVQMDTIYRCTAAVLSYCGRGPEWTFAHREWAPSRKIDPISWDMRQFRSMVGQYMSMEPQRRPEWRDQRWYTLLVYAKQATNDEYSAIDAYKIAPSGVFTLNPTQALTAVQRGEIVITVGGPSSREVFGDKLPGGPGVHVIDGKHMAVVGGNSEETAALVKDLAKNGWRQ